MATSKPKNPKLPVAFKRKWVNALRSGEYEQGTDHLMQMDDDGNKTFCCLGVAMDITGNSPDDEGTIDNTIHSTKGIPACLIGACDDNPLVQKLVKMNDGDSWGDVKKEPKSFKQIAAYIDRYL